MSVRTLAVAAVLFALAGPVAAQNAGVDRRLERMERDLRTLNAIVLQAQATGQPVEVKPEGPDPALAALQARIDDLQSTLQRVNGGIENLTFELEQARRSAAEDNTAQALTIRDLGERLGRLEALAAGAAPAAEDLAAAPPPPPAAAPIPPRNRGAAATARAQAGDTGALEPPPGANPFAPAPPAAPTPQTATAAFQNARALYTSGDFASAGDAFNDFLARYPENARAPEAYYWLGESFYAQRGWRNAIPAYAASLKAQPKTAWAPASMVRLAQSLSQSGQNPQACAALSEYSRLYAARATAAVKADAAAVRTRAKCA